MPKCWQLRKQNELRSTDILQLHHLSPFSPSPFSPSPFSPCPLSPPPLSPPPLSPCPLSPCPLSRKSFKHTRIPDKLSPLLRAIDSSITASTHFPSSYSSSGQESPTAFQISLPTSFELILSKIPSQPTKMKSCSSWISYFLISASAITQSGIPPNSLAFASISPNARVTDSFPGNTLRGPMLRCLDSQLSYLPLMLINSVRYIFPPRERILACSLRSAGLWSRLRLQMRYPRLKLRIARLSPVFATYRVVPTMSSTMAHDPLLSI